ncbi:PHP domain-containing protein [Kineococcus rhizosphaerae]|uniref:Histidinol-phosphatase (PHP family) n=1 Tax=Kineococcus rhizosphaerae TaxID=559628 RepID=A0A2T0QYN3_9ACTN|nr:PHP domain-containing protein [Kineococcus rhizosphaerae]PRY11483.1 histidinol-phosphatase (PHP family) [Kineococcus rhizosphaerae]
MLPPDGHVHSEFSWDARRVGSMRATCARAVAIGLPSVAFTEHVDLTPFRAGFLAGSFGDLVDADGILHAPLPDFDAYAESLDRCRAEFPGLEVLSGREVGQPHLHVAELAALPPVDRVVGSLHCLWDEEASAYAEPWLLFEDRPAPDVFRDYLAEVCRMGPGDFDTFAHLDYPVRSWPGEFDPRDFEEELRTALRSLTDRCLEINTRLPLHPTILRWWAEEGGRRVTFGSDAHEARFVGTGFAQAGERASAAGFAPGRRPGDPWVRA